MPKTQKVAKQLKAAAEVIDRAKVFESRIADICKTDPWVEIELRSGDGSEKFKLEYSFGAMRTLYRATGRNAQMGDLQMNDLADMELLLKVLHAGLITHQPELTEDDVANMINMKHRVYYAHVITKAINATNPDLEDLTDLLERAAEVTGENDGELEAGDTTAPLPEIVPSPISGPSVD